VKLCFLGGGNDRRQLRGSGNRGPPLDRRLRRAHERKWCRTKNCRSGTPVCVHSTRRPAALWSSRPTAAPYDRSRCVTRPDASRSTWHLKPCATPSPTNHTNRIRPARRRRTAVHRARVHLTPDWLALRGQAARARDAPRVASQGGPEIQHGRCPRHGPTPLAER
jgi:hypothetical protein